MHFLSFFLVTLSHRQLHCISCITIGPSFRGSKLKSGEYLSKPIVDLGKKTMNVNMEANPAFLKMTDNGEKLLEGETNLAAPITEAPQLAKKR